MTYDNTPRRNLFFVKSSKIKYDHKTCLTLMKTLRITITDYFQYFWTFLLLLNVAVFSNKKSSEF